jgi:hypothetical protein
MSAMQRYVASRPMFMDLKVMNKDALFVLGTKEEGGCKDIPELHKALSTVYSEILGTNDLLFSFFPNFLLLTSLFFGLFFNSLYSMHESKKLQNVQKISSKS